MRVISFFNVNIKTTSGKLLERHDTKSKIPGSGVAVEIVQ